MSITHLLMLSLFDINTHSWPSLRDIIRGPNKSFALESVRQFKAQWTELERLLNSSNNQVLLVVLAKNEKIISQVLQAGLDEEFRTATMDRDRVKRILDQLQSRVDSVRTVGPDVEEKIGEYTAVGWFFLEVNDLLEQIGTESRVSYAQLLTETRDWLYKILDALSTVYGPKHSTTKLISEAAASFNFALNHLTVGEQPGSRLPLQPLPPRQGPPGTPRRRAAPRGQAPGLAATQIERNEARIFRFYTQIFVLSAEADRRAYAERAPWAMLKHSEPLRQRAIEHANSKGRDIPLTTAKFSETLTDGRTQSAAASSLARAPFARFVPEERNFRAATLNI